MAIVLGLMMAAMASASIPPLPYVPGSTNAWEALSLLTALTDGRGNQTRYDYSAVHDLIRKVRADSSFQAYTNNARGWLVGRTDPNGKTTSYQYNNAGQLTGIDYPTDTDVELSYHNLGRMTSRVDQAGTWTWTYDGETFRAISETLRSPTGEAWAVQYSYHPETFDLASVSFGSYTTLYTWAAGRLTNVSLVSSVLSGGQFSYSYLPNSDLLSGMSNPVFQITRAYDSLDRLTNISSFVPSVPFVANSFSYSLDSVGRRTARQDADGSQLAWGYDFYDQLISAKLTNACPARGGGAADAAYNFGYQYDQGGNRLHEDRGQMDLDGSFNNLNQITTLNWAGKLDVVGSVGATGAIVKVRGTNAVLYNLTNFLGGATLKAGSNNIPIVAWLGTNATEMNRTVYMPPIKPQVFLWDPNGNLTNDGQRAYFWDEENRLTQIETTASATNMGIPKRKSVYGYDGMGRRTQKTDYSAWNGAAYATTNVTRFVWDGWLLISETQVSGLTSQVFFYVWGQDLSQSLQGAGGIGGLLCVIRNGTPYYPLSDANGSVSDYLDATGTVVAHREYDPFGRTLVSTGPMKDAFTFWFSTKYHESFWNLCYLGYRWYSPNLGVFLSNDPLGEQADLNMIRFCRNNPIDYTDPLGLQEEETPAEEIRTVEAEDLMLGRGEVSLRTIRDLQTWLDGIGGFPEGSQSYMELRGLRKEGQELLREAEAPSLGRSDPETAARVGRRIREFLARAWPTVAQLKAETTPEGSGCLLGLRWNALTASEKLQEARSFSTRFGAGAFGKWALGRNVDLKQLEKEARIENLLRTAEIGREAHRQIEAEGVRQGGNKEVTLTLKGGQVVRKDIVMGKETIIVKPDTPSGLRRAEARDALMRKNGYLPGVFLYDPADPRFLEGSPTYMGPESNE